MTVTPPKVKKYSRKREAILEAIQYAEGHPTAAWLYQTLKPQFPDLSLDTIYRNLRLFKEEGLIVSLGSLNGQEHFEFNDQHHGHFICRVCQCMIDIPISEGISQQLSSVQELKGLQIEKLDLTIHGLCPSCQ